eukprot:gnl/TRDRNA2_/TRDRNA2_27789_c0_seq1.p1 gnl/TRDRNA2_/TRDRNA2_27789_c0~~gnl/TRDRNA2_/TRDRNA2_27789_c0_seq1.p1  ORF type:complete len:324 (-),score=62.31 gnl/TRDRNA2_/TRDRNA2_27789_c0_seq1:136-1035(-)
MASMEKVKEMAAAAAEDKAAKEKATQERLERVQKGLEEAKKKKRTEDREKAAAEKRKKQKAVAMDGLYAGLPAPDPLKDAALAKRQAEKAASAKGWTLRPLPAPELSKVIFLDIDGVLRPLSAGGFQSMMVDGEFALKADTSDFIASSMLALRHIVESTGAVTVLSSEWRRDEVMREGVDKILTDYEMPKCITWTPTDLARDLGTEDPFQAFAERRAREISTWLRKNPHVVQWVVLDDINMAVVDDIRKPDTLRMTERIVQTHRKIGLTMENAKAAVRLLRGEKLPPQVLEDQPKMELL